MLELNNHTLGSVREMRNTLLPLFQEDQADWPNSLTQFDLSNTDFEWLKPIVEFSLDESVLLYLNANEPDINRFVTLDLKEHISEATSLIDNTIAKRNEIFGLETQALLTAIEYIQLANTIESDEKLGELAVKSNFQQSNFPPADLQNYSDALSAKFNNIKLTLRTRLSLHNQVGNPLNFGERLSYLRRLYADNIRIIYERIIAIKRTLKYSYHQETLPIPNYIRVANSLDRLVWWMRDAISKFETKDQFDYVFQRTIPISRLRPVDSIAALRSGNFEMIVSADDFGLSNETFERMRLLGLSVNVIGHYTEIPNNVTDVGAQYHQNNVTADKSNGDTYRDIALYRCEIIPPEQNTQIDTEYLFEMTDDQVEEVRYALAELSKKAKKSMPTDFGTIDDFVIDHTGNIKLVLKPRGGDVAILALPRKLVIGELQTVYKTSINSNHAFRSDNSIKNISPLGSWGIRLENISFDEGLRNWGLTDLRDVSLTFRIGVRRF